MCHSEHQEADQLQQSLQMLPHDAEKISMNLIFLAERTKNLEPLITTLMRNQLMDKSDRERIMSRPKNDQSLEMYLIVIQKGSNRFKEFVQCLQDTGNGVAASRLQEPSIDFSVAVQGFQKHWPFTLLLLALQLAGISYWSQKIFHAAY